MEAPWVTNPTWVVPELQNIAPIKPLQDEGEIENAVT